jgi:hypothetical protein
MRTLAEQQARFIQDLVDARWQPPEPTAPAPVVLTWATGGPYPHDYNPRTAGGFGCDPCHGCGKRPEAGARIWMNCYHDLYCDPCARRNDAAWRGQRHPFKPPMFGNTYCSHGACGATRDGEQHQPAGTNPIERRVNDVPHARAGQGGT